ncbi:MAG: phospholipase, partial [Muribaculaceae bacterium]|nr:phospholipase [Muribaculaceae bacterium]
AGRQDSSYTEPEIEEFRDILLTLLPDDIAPWARSLQLRGISLPEPVRDELLLIVAEARAARSQSSES